MSTAETTSRPAYDQQERERVRRSLRRYMEEHRIGTPTLQLRIIEADARQRELPLSTLQRFITGSHRTSDAYVDMCRRFLESVGVEGETADFAAVMAGQFGGGDSKQAQELAAAFAHEYVLDASPWDTEGSGDVPYAIARFDQVPGKPYLKIAEEAHDMIRPTASPRRHRYEGALVFNDRLVHGFLRSCLTRQPKTYALRYPGSDEASSRTLLEGAVQYANSENEIRQLAVRLRDIRNPLRHVRADEELT
jgi:hypothetical protein